MDMVFRGGTVVTSHARFPADVYVKGEKIAAIGTDLTVPEGTKTDGASIPRALWGVCGHPLEAPRVYAAIVHDWLYGGGGPVGMTRAEADAVYRDLLVAYGWGRWRAWIEWTALRVCGASHWTSRTEKEK